MYSRRRQIVDVQRFRFACLDEPAAGDLSNRDVTRQNSAPFRQWKRIAGIGADRDGVIVKRYRPVSRYFQGDRQGSINLPRPV